MMPSWFESGKTCRVLSCRPAAYIKNLKEFFHFSK